MIRIRWITVMGMLAMALAGRVPAEPLTVTVATTLIGTVVSGIGGDRVALVSVIPYAMCPGHFDLSPRKASEIAASDLLLVHGFEAFTRGLTFAGGGPRRVTLAVQGNAMVPQVHRRLALAVADALCEAAPEDAGFFRRRTKAYLEGIDGVEASLEKDRARLQDVPVLAAAMIAPFVEWTGCKVTGAFPRDESVSARTMQILLRDGRDRSVRLVVENRQSMGRTGRRLAEFLKVPLVVLDNFPDPEAGGYPESLQEALRRLNAAIAP